jgi:hypothetical protein
MQEHQPNLRSAADRAFRESLEQLENILPPEPQTAESDFHSEGDFPAKSQPDSKLWEEAAADLDAFFQDNPLPLAEMSDEEGE